MDTMDSMDTSQPGGRAKHHHASHKPFGKDSRRQSGLLT
jgi:hypothetical protein